MNADFNKDKDFSEKCQPFFDAYYESNEFKEKIREYRPDKELQIIKKDRSNNALFQKMTYLDVVFQFNTGSSLLIDEKACRYKENYNSDFFPIEIVSNPEGKSDGWAYHVGTTIVMAYFELDEKGNPVMMRGEPVIFCITPRFIEEVVHKNPERIKWVKSTNGLYNSAVKYVHKSILRRYFP